MQNERTPDATSAANAPHDSEWIQYATTRPVGTTNRIKDDELVAVFRDRLERFRAWVETYKYLNRSNSKQSAGHACLSVARICAWTIGDEWAGLTDQELWFSSVIALITCALLNWYRYRTMDMDTIEKYLALRKAQRSSPSTLRQVMHHFVLFTDWIVWRISDAQVIALAGIRQKQLRQLREGFSKIRRQEQMNHRAELAIGGGYTKDAKNRITNPDSQQLGEIMRRAFSLSRPKMESIIHKQEISATDLMFVNNMLLVALQIVSVPVRSAERCSMKIQDVDVIVRLNGLWVTTAGKNCHNMDRPKITPHTPEGVRILLWYRDYQRPAMMRKFGIPPEVAKDSLFLNTKGPMKRLCHSNESFWKA